MKIKELLIFNLTKTIFINYGNEINKCIGGCWNYWYIVIIYVWFIYIVLIKMFDFHWYFYNDS